MITNLIRKIIGKEDFKGKMFGFIGGIVFFISILLCFYDVHLMVLHTIVLIYSLLTISVYNLNTLSYLKGLLLGLVLGIFPLTIILCLIFIKEIYPDFLNPILAIIILFILAEGFFFLDKRKPKNKKDIKSFTIKRKIEAWIEAILLSLYGLGGYYALVKIEILDILKRYSIIIYNELREVLPIVLKYMLWAIIIVIAAIIIFYLLKGYIKLNSLKYKNCFNKKKRNAKKRR